MHKEIIECQVGFEIDHINMNKLDNTKQNLRIVNRQQNMMNKIKYKNNKSGFKGVHCLNKRGKLVIFAEIGFCGKKIKLGRYNNIEDAVIAYNIMALKLHKEYAKLNTLPFDVNDDKISEIENKLNLIKAVKEVLINNEQ